MPIEIKSAGILGGGVMGGGIGQALALGGLKVAIRDLNDELLEKTRSTIVDGRYGLAKGVERGKTSQEQMDSAIANLSFTTKVEDLKDVDLIIEAVPEDKELKLKVWGEMDGLMQEQAVFATNTSGLVIGELSQAVKEARRPRFIGMHWFSPAPIMKLVELIHAPDTAEETIQALESVCERIGKVSVRVKDAPGKYGFIANRVFYAAIREAQAILEEGVASEEDINKAMMYGYNWPVGPLAMRAQARKGWQ